MRTVLTSVTLLCAGAGMVAAAISENRRHGEPAPAIREEARPTRADAPSYSNIEAADYVGPEVCAECHPDKHDAWRRHPHRVMNQHPSADTVLGDFDDRAVDYGDYQARFTTSAGEYFVSLFEDGELVRRFRVTKTIGSRFTQMYAGVQVHGPEPAHDSLYFVERKLPFGYFFRGQRWLPELYFDSDFPALQTASWFRRVVESPQHAMIPWDDNCIKCHNTYPYRYRLQFSLRSENRHRGFPPGDVVADPPPEQADQYRSLHADGLVTLGISCESCHFGGREHAIEGKEIRFVPTSPIVTLRKPERASPAATDREDPYVVNSICAQCHHSLISTYANGAGTWNAREAIDLAAGECSGAIKCTDCHDPHAAGPPGGGPDDPQHVAACIGCHEALGTAAARARHSRHGADVNCLDCHMPRMVQGIATVIRTHRISSPTDLRMLESGSPNACNLCHLDRSIRWTTEQLSSGWDVTLSARESWVQAYGGDLDTPVGAAWLAHGVPQVRLVAADAYARSPLAETARPALYRALADPVAVNRVFASFAIETITGVRLTDYDPLQPPWIAAAGAGVIESAKQWVSGDDKQQ